MYIRDKACTVGKQLSTRVACSKKKGCVVVHWNIYLNVLVI